jgi:hypothetical protein
VMSARTRSRQPNNDLKPRAVEHPSFHGVTGVPKSFTATSADPGASSPGSRITASKVLCSPEAASPEATLQVCPC